MSANCLRSSDHLTHEKTDEKLHIKALNLKISSLEAENIVLTARINELESRLQQLSGESAKAYGFRESLLISANPGSAFKPVHNQSIVKQATCSEIQAFSDDTQWLEPGSVPSACVRSNRYNEAKVVNNIQSELNVTCEECALAQEKIVQLGCINFELENQLKDVKEKLEGAEFRARKAEKQAAESRQNCTRQKQEQNTSEADFVAKLTNMEAKMNELKEELLLKNEQLEAAIMQNNKHNEEMKQWHFAFEELEAVHLDLRRLEKQLKNEKAAMESKWSEVRAKLLEREGDISRKNSGTECVCGDEQSGVVLIGQSMDTINDLKSTINGKNKKLEHDKAEKRKLKVVIRKLQADKELLEAVSKVSEEEQRINQCLVRIDGLQKQRDFMDQEIARLCTMNYSKDVLIQELHAKLESLQQETLDMQFRRNENRVQNDRGRQSGARVEFSVKETSELSDFLEKNTERKEMQECVKHLEMDYQKSNFRSSFCSEHAEQQKAVLHADVGAHHYAQQYHEQGEQMEWIRNESTDSPTCEVRTSGSSEQSAAVEMNSQMQQLMSCLQKREAEMQKILFEKEALRMRCDELVETLRMVTCEMERRGKEKDDIIEMLQSQHTYLTQTILLNEKPERNLEMTQTVSQNVSLKANTEVIGFQDASTNTEQDIVMTKSMSDGIETPLSHDLSVAESDSVIHLCETTEEIQEPLSETVHSTTNVNDPFLEGENELLRRCVNESNQMQDNLTDDIKQLLVLNAELETAVEVLKAEIWTLSGQLRASLADREDLSEKLCELSQRHDEEIERARERERDLEEQKDVAEKSQRQAALAENESNRRLVEWQEKSAEMERRRLELENAYSQLTGYYQQLQQAYNVLYARVNAYKIDKSSQTTLDCNALEQVQEAAEKNEILKRDFSKQEMEINRQRAELEQIRNLLSKHLLAAQKNIKDLKGINLLKEFTASSVQMIHAQLREASEELCLRVKEAVAKFVEKDNSKNVEIATAIQQLRNGVLEPGIAAGRSSPAAVVVQCGSNGSWKCSTPCTICRELMQTKQPGSTPQLQLAILAARLTTKLADNDALFRCNAELAQTNLQLQNELEEKKKEILRLTAANGDIHCALQTKDQKSEVILDEQKLEESEWTWKNESKSEKDYLINSNASIMIGNDFEKKSQSPKHLVFENIPEPSKVKEIGAERLKEFEIQKQIVKGLEKKLHETEENSLQHEQKYQKLQSNAEQLVKRLEALGEYCSELEMKIQQLENELQIKEREVIFWQQKIFENETEMEKIANLSQSMSLESRSDQQKDLIEKLNQQLTELKIELEFTKKLYGDEKKYRETKVVEEISEQESSNLGMRKLQGSWGWYSAHEHSKTQDSAQEQIQKSTKREQFRDISAHAEGSNEFIAVEEDRLQVSQNLNEQLWEKEIKVEEVERDKSLTAKLESQQKLVEGMEKKLSITEKYSMDLEFKNVSLERQILEMKEKYASLLDEKNNLSKKMEEEISEKIQQEILMLGKNNEALTAQLAENELAAKEEQSKISIAFVSLEQQLIKQWNASKEIEGRLQEVLEENSHLKRHLEDYGMQVDELQRVNDELISQKNEADRDFQKQLGGKLKEITRLKQQIHEVSQQNELLKDSEQRLMDSLDSSSEELAKIKSENDNMKYEIDILQTELEEAKEIMQHVNDLEKPFRRSTSTMTEMEQETGSISTAVNSVDYSDMQKKIDELRQKFNKTKYDNVLAEETAEYSQHALRKKKKHHSRTGARAIPTVKYYQPTKVTIQNADDVDICASKQKSLVVDEAYNAALQTAVQQFHQLSGDKLRRRKGAGSRGAEKQ